MVRPDQPPSLGMAVGWCRLWGSAGRLSSLRGFVGPRGQPGVAIQAARRQGGPNIPPGLCLGLLDGLLGHAQRGGRFL